jgi:hypothetical protein
VGSTADEYRALDRLWPQPSEVERSAPEETNLSLLVKLDRVRHGTSNKRLGPRKEIEMARRLNELEDELDRFRRERSALDKLTAKMVAFEAAMRVMARHKLMVEFADEISAINAEER